MADQQALLLADEERVMGVCNVPVTAGRPPAANCRWAVVTKTSTMIVEGPGKLGTEGNDFSLKRVPSPYLARQLSRDDPL
uniref:Uncharacterized protein n=1 Tax=Oryza sativa subsp. japonica TaxID=39947 RepID=Q6K5B3_ORYSJ|nr:hypothetical protein [Oryza sativa Japonica Group]